MLCREIDVTYRGRAQLPRASRHLPGTWPPEGMQRGGGTPSPEAWSRRGGQQAPEQLAQEKHTDTLGSRAPRAPGCRPPEGEAGWGQGSREPRAVAHQREKPDGVRGPVSPGLLPTRGRSRNVSLPVGVKPQSWRPCRVREQPRHQERRTETPQAGGRQAQPLPRGPREADASEQTHRDCKGGPTGRLGRGGTANSWCCSGNFL